MLDYRNRMVTRARAKGGPRAFREEAGEGRASQASDPPASTTPEPEPEDDAA